MTRTEQELVDAIERVLKAWQAGELVVMDQGGTDAMEGARTAYRRATMKPEPQKRTRQC